MVILQTALTVACLGAAGLVIQSLLNVLKVEPGWQVVLNGTSFAVRTGTDPAATTAAVRTAISEIDRDVPIASVRTMRGVVSESVADRSFQATLLTLFGVIAVALSGIGVFGVMALASYVSVHRATAVDPLEALKAE